jgi:hypothetical protein
VPITPIQLAANRANAAKSIGSHSPEGNARSASNARSHGFTASNFAVVRIEDLHQVADLKTDLTAVYRPVNSQERFALERMALTQQAILRAARLESGLFTNCLNEALDTNDRPFSPMSPDLAGDGDIEITRAQNRNYALADGFHRMARQSNSWSLFLRYQAQSERHYRRAVEEFDRLKALRAELPSEPILEDQPEESETACAPPDEPISTPQPNPEPPVNSHAPEVGAIGGRGPTSSKPSEPAAILVGQAPWPAADPLVGLFEPSAPTFGCGYAALRSKPSLCVGSARPQESRGAARRRKPIVCRGAVGDYLSEAHRDIFRANALFRRHPWSRISAERTC